MIVGQWFGSSHHVSSCTAHIIATGIGMDVFSWHAPTPIIAVGVVCLLVSTGRCNMAAEVIILLMLCPM